MSAPHKRHFSRKVQPLWDYNWKPWDAQTLLSWLAPDDRNISQALGVLVDWIWCCSQKLPVDDNKFGVYFPICIILDNAWPQIVAWIGGSIEKDDLGWIWYCLDSVIKKEMDNETKHYGWQKKCFSLSLGHNDGSEPLTKNKMEAAWHCNVDWIGFPPFCARISLSLA